MKRPLRVAALVLLICGVAPYVTAADASSATAPGAAAASSCEDKAVDKNGKKLSGAAKTSFMKKCEADATSAK
ncbi:MAG TPA: hypothetical protein VED47_11645 [Burkholderiaceae bacterium]|nr:hypothetical protein [Burkholderiaceae bacterium]